MDVFIPEEYVMKRRMERKAASLGNGNKKTSSTSSKMVSDSGGCNFEKEKKARQPSFGIDQTKFLVSSGVGENNFVFTCFSA